MSALKQKQLLLKYDNSEDLLIVMIRGRHFKYEGNKYYFHKGDNSFKQIKLSDCINPDVDADVGVSIGTGVMCRMLVGNELTDADPIFIPVDTLLLVSDCPIVEGAKSDTPVLRYFSHWLESEIFCFTAGANSLTAGKTTHWKHYKHYDPIIAPDNTKENNNV